MELFETQPYTRKGKFPNIIARRVRFRLIKIIIFCIKYLCG